MKHKSQCHMPDNNAAFSFSTTGESTTISGLLLPDDESVTSSWTCSCCQTSRGFDEIQKFVSGIEKELRELCSKKASIDNLRYLEDFISKASLKIYRV